ncbi:MAG: hypothetical protein WD645_01545 [Dehalococcoidia bacterium]
MELFYLSIAIAFGAPALAVAVKRATGRQAAAMAAVLWTMAQPPYFGTWIWRSINTDDQFLPLVLYAVAGAVIATVAGVWAAFLPPSLKFQRLLFLVAAVGALLAAGVWEFLPAGRVLAFAAAAAFLALAVSPQPHAARGYIPRRLSRRRPR